MRVGVTGHQQAPQHAWDYVEREMRSRLVVAAPPLVGVTSLAAGADQLFARLVLEVGGAVEVIVPSDGYGDTFDDGGAEYRFLLGRAASSTKLEFAAPSEEAFFEAGKRIVRTVDLVIAVWDGEDAKGVGGTADVVRYARSRGVTVEVIWPMGVRR